MDIHDGLEQHVDTVIHLGQLSKVKMRYLCQTIVSEMMESSLWTNVSLMAALNLLNMEY